MANWSALGAVGQGLNQGVQNFFEMREKMQEKRMREEAMAWQKDLSTFQTVMAAAKSLPAAQQSAYYGRIAQGGVKFSTPGFSELFQNLTTASDEATKSIEKSVSGLTKALQNGEDPTPYAIQLELSGGLSATSIDAISKAAGLNKQATAIKDFGNFIGGSQAPNNGANLPSSPPMSPVSPLPGLGGRNDFRTNLPTFAPPSSPVVAGAAPSPMSGLTAGSNNADNAYNFQLFNKGNAAGFSPSQTEYFVRKPPKDKTENMVKVERYNPATGKTTAQYMPKEKAAALGEITVGQKEAQEGKDPEQVAYKRLSQSTRRLSWFMPKGSSGITVNTSTGDVIMNQGVKDSLYEFATKNKNTSGGIGVASRNWLAANDAYEGAVSGTSQKTPQATGATRSRRDALLGIAQETE